MSKTTRAAALAKPGEIRIGISGWRYKGWRGVFYPPKLAQRRELEFASRIFNTIEINGTFYSLQHHTSFQRWEQETPDDFLFSIKGSRFITHMKKLRGVDQAFANLLASGLLALGPKARSDPMAVPAANALRSRSLCRLLSHPAPNHAGSREACQDV